MPEFDFSTERVYTHDGEVIRQIQTKARKPVLPILIKGSTSTEYLENERRLLYAMSPKRGDGALKVYTVDDKTRVLTCRMLEAPISDGHDTGLYTASNAIKGPTQWRKFPVTFFVPNPFYYDPLENDVYVDGVSLTVPIGLYNAGDDVAWPIWSIAGPMTSVGIYNETTGKSMYITLTLTSDVRLYIDSRPLLRSTLQNHTTKKESSLSTGSTRFPLESGHNEIHCEFAGSSTGTSLRARWVNRYLGV